MTNIKNTAKQILELLLKQAIVNGDTKVFFSYPEAMERLDIQDRNFLRVCMLYLYDAKYLKFIRNENDDVKFVEITHKGIDFVEDN